MIGVLGVERLHLTIVAAVKISAQLLDSLTNSGQARSLRSLEEYEASISRLRFLLMAFLCC